MPPAATATASTRGARVLAVADAFVAMTSERPFRRARRPAEAVGLLVEGRGSAYEPDVVDALVHHAGTWKLRLETV